MLKLPPADFILQSAWLSSKLNGCVAPRWEIVQSARYMLKLVNIRKEFSVCLRVGACVPFVAPGCQPHEL